MLGTYIPYCQACPSIWQCWPLLLQCPQYGPERAGEGQQQCSCFWSHTIAVFKASTELAMLCRAGALWQAPQEYNYHQQSQYKACWAQSLPPGTCFQLHWALTEAFSHRPCSCSQALPLLTLEALQPSPSLSTQLRGGSRLSSPSRYSSPPSAGLRLYFYSLLSRNTHSKIFTH